MNLQQLRYLCAVVDANFSVSRAAGNLYTSQPGISKQIQLLERELGVEVLVRKGNRIVGLTGPGKEIHAVAQRMVWDAGNLKRIGEEHSHQGRGHLVVATTHIHARYVLRPVIREFTARHPEVSLALRQGNPSQIAHWVTSGEADLGISASGLEDAEELVFLPCAKLERSVITLPDHPLQREKRISLASIARHPVITLDAQFAGGATVIQAFTDAGITPNIVLSATDADVIKAYVEIGQGVAILPSIAYEPERDRHLAAIDASHLFAPTTSHIGLRRGKYLRHYMRDFIAMIAPDWDQNAIEHAVHNRRK